MSSPCSANWARAPERKPWLRHLNADATVPSRCNAIRRARSLPSPQDGQSGSPRTNGFIESPGEKGIEEPSQPVGRVPQSHCAGDAKTRRWWQAQTVWFAAAQKAFSAIVLGGTNGDEASDVVKAGKPQNLSQIYWGCPCCRRIRGGAPAGLGCRSSKHWSTLPDNGKHGANWCGLRRGRQARCGDGQRRRRHQIARGCQTQSYHLRCAERYDRDTDGDGSPDHQQQAFGDSWLLRVGAHSDRQRGRRARESADHHRLKFRPAEQGPHLYVHAFCPRLSICPGAIADVKTRRRKTEGGGYFREYRFRHLNVQRVERAGAG